jgi:uncharacterized membrane protein
MEMSLKLCPKARMRIMTFAFIELVIILGASQVSMAQTVTTKNPEIRFYNIDIRINDQGRSYVSQTMTFMNPETVFSFKILGRVENFKATSNAGPVDCSVSVSGISDVSCQMNLTETQKELKITFETTDFVKSLDNKMLFSGDLSTKTKIDDISVTLRLPPGVLLVGEEVSSSILSYTNNASAHIGGDSIIVIWKLVGFSPDNPLKLEVLYEKVNSLSFSSLIPYILLGGVFAVVLGFIIIRHLKKTDEVVLSVLDEYERKIVDIISKGGEIKQKKIVELTDLSKAKVSRVIKSLAERGIIEVEHSGRTNRVKLSKKPFQPKKIEPVEEKSPDN